MTVKDETLHETDYTEEAVCPHCGQVVQGTWEYFAKYNVKSEIQELFVC